MTPTSRVTMRVNITPMELPALPMASPPITDHEASWRGTIVIVVHLMIAMSLDDATEEAGKEFEDTVNGIFVLCVPLSSLDRLLPQRVVRLLERTEVCGDSLLLTPDSVYAFNDGMDVDGLTLTFIILRKRRMEKGAFFGRWGGRRVSFTLDKREEVGLTTVKVRVCELDGFVLIVHAQQTLLQGRDLAESIEIELTNERGEVLVLEPFPK